MLKTSPILSTSANASPASFRYAPPASPKNQSKPSSAVRQRQSSRSTPSPADSMRSPALHRPRPHAAGDAGPQGSPMEDQQHEVSPPQQPPAPLQPLHSPRAHPAPDLSTTASQQTVDQATQESQVQNAVSPNKRRGSPSVNSTQPTLVGSPPQTTKRPRPDAPPPKIVPLLYEFCAVEDIVELISHMLAELIATNDAIRISNGGLTRFHSRFDSTPNIMRRFFTDADRRTPPGISVRDYLHRLARHATLTPPLLLAMVYYIDRLCAMYPEFTINTLTVHRFLITAATVAAKGLSDSFWNNTTYARVGGVRVAELKLLELEFLYRVDWKIVPNPEVLVAYYKGLVERTPGYKLESDGSEAEDEDEIEEDGEASKPGA
ncbi:hypothetical protein G7046_g7964 [Stylonectria norvegica]|nr:hypothetical protein G7046_g7964 [Stylonectria norvegica]